MHKSQIGIWSFRTKPLRFFLCTRRWYFCSVVSSSSLCPWLSVRFSLRLAGYQCHFAMIQSYTVAFSFVTGRNRVEDCGSAKTECWSFRNEITTRNVGWKSVGINDDIHTRNDMPQHLAAAFLLLLFLIIYLIRLASWHKTKEEDWFLTGHHHYCWTRSVRRWAEE